MVFQHDDCEPGYSPEIMEIINRSPPTCYTTSVDLETELVQHRRKTSSAPDWLWMSKWFWSIKTKEVETLNKLSTLHIPCIKDYVGTTLLWLEQSRDTDQILWITMTSPRDSVKLFSTITSTCHESLSVSNRDDTRDWTSTERGVV